jgi:hypothetical protein
MHFIHSAVNIVQYAFFVHCGYKTYTINISIEQVSMVYQKIYFEYLLNIYYTEVTIHVKLSDGIQYQK